MPLRRKEDELQFGHKNVEKHRDGSELVVSDVAKAAEKKRHHHHHHHHDPRTHNTNKDGREWRDTKPPSSHHRDHKRY